MKIYLLMTFTNSVIYVWYRGLRISNLILSICFWYEIKNFKGAIALKQCCSHIGAVASDQQRYTSGKKKKAVSFAGMQLWDMAQREPLALNLLISSWMQLPVRLTKQCLWTMRSPIAFCLWTALSSLPQAAEDREHVSNGSSLKS